MRVTKKLWLFRHKCSVNDSGMLMVKEPHAHVKADGSHSWGHIHGETIIIPGLTRLIGRGEKKLVKVTIETEPNP